MLKLKELEVKNRNVREISGKSLKKSKKRKITIDPIIENVESVEITGVAGVAEIVEVEETESSASTVEDILFKLPDVSNPLIGTPKNVQKQLDSIVKKIQKNPYTDESIRQFNKIHLYMHGYLINIVLKQFPYIRGMQTVDIYQQTLIALWTKAIPGFKRGKGMSFLNFAKMCIRRHLITLLNASKNRQKDQSINRAVSLDGPINPWDEDSSNTLSNTIADHHSPTDKITEDEEAFRITKNSLFSILSEFERVVLGEYLSTSTYREIAKNVSKKTKKRCVTKSVDNALLRIRKKAIYLKRHSKVDDVPLFIV